MALTLFLFLSLLLCKSQINGLVFPVTRDQPTGQYVAHIRLGDSSEPVKLVVDLAASLVWFDCSSGPASSSRSFVSGSSSGCLKARVGSERISEDCDLLVRNGVEGIAARGELAGDVLSSGSSPVDILFACAPPWLLRGLSSGAQGVMGLGRAHISLPSQLAAQRRRLTLHLSSTNGVVSTSSVEEVFGAAASRSLLYTPLSSGSYVINVRSIRVNGKKISVDTPLATELSTVVPYTMLESSIFSVFAQAYTEAAREATVVPPVAPFGLCFASSMKDFPAVELALQSEMVRWRIHGHNLMVDVGGGLRCLGIVDGGSSRVNPVVMGGLQLQGFLLDFDLGNSMMGFAQITPSHLQANHSS